MSTDEDITYTIRRDGNAWCATRSDFVDLQTSPAGFGDTPVDALTSLLHNLKPETTLQEDVDALRRIGGGGGKDVTAVGRCVPRWGMK